MGSDWQFPSQQLLNQQLPQPHTGSPFQPLLTIRLGGIADDNRAPVEMEVPLGGVRIDIRTRTKKLSNRLSINFPESLSYTRGKARFIHRNDKNDPEPMVQLMYDLSAKAPAQRQTQFLNGYLQCGDLMHDYIQPYMDVICSRWPRVRNVEAWLRQWRRNGGVINGASTETILQALQLIEFQDISASQWVSQLSRKLIWILFFNAERGWEYTPGNAPHANTPPLCLENYGQMANNSYHLCRSPSHTERLFRQGSEMRQAAV